MLFEWPRDQALAMTSPEARIVSIRLVAVLGRNAKCLCDLGSSDVLLVLREKLRILLK